MPYRTGSVDGHVSGWETTWTHFGALYPAFRALDWLQIRLTEENRAFVLDTLRGIHVPGELRDGLVTVCGHRQDCGYL